VEVGDHVIVQHPDQLVDQESIAMGHFMPGAGPLRKAARQFRAPAIERVAQQRDHRRPHFGRRRFRHHGGDRGGKHAAIDHRALVGNGRSSHPDDIGTDRLR
jgi:hypothetical protein